MEFDGIRSEEGERVEVVKKRCLMSCGLST